MTLDDLEKIFDEAAVPKTFWGRDNHRRGLVAVVEALRDDLLPQMGDYGWDELETSNWFDRILGGSE